MEHEEYVRVRRGGREVRGVGGRRGAPHEEGPINLLIK
jgi:hypothetical protein